MRAGAAALVAALLMLPGPPARAQSDDLAARAAAGKDAMAAGRFDEAARIYDELARALPRHAGMSLNLGLAHAMAGRPAEAIPALERATELDPTLLPAWLFLGMTLVETGAADRAVAPLERAVGLDPSHVEARRLLAGVLLDTGKPQQAARHYRELTTRAPGDPRGWYGLGVSYETLARQAFDELRTTAPDSPFASILAADVLVTGSKYARAVALYRDAQRQLPPMASLHQAVADAYERAGRTDWAAAERAKIARLETPCDSRPSDCAWMAGKLLDVLTANSGRTGAEAAFWRAKASNALATEAFARLEGAPPSRELHLVRASLESSRGNHVGAVKELRAALAFDPSDPSVTLQLASALLLAREPGEAEALLAPLATRTPDLPDLARLYGTALLDAQKVSEAVPWLERAVAASPESVDAHAALGRALVLAGDAARAIPHLERAGPLDADGSISYQLARAYQSAGRTDDARRAMEAYRLKQGAGTDATASAEEPEMTPPN